MKQIPMLLVLGVALSLCNLLNKSKNTGTSGSGGSGTTSSSNGATVEKAAPTAAQTAALAGGQSAKWDSQGMSWTVPAKWTQSTNDEKSFLWRSPGGSEAANLIVSISPMSEDFPTEVSIKAFYDGAKTRSKNGEVDEVKWLEIDGVKGVEFRESNPKKSDDFRRLQWLAYRKYSGQVQMVNVMLSSNGKGFAEHQDAMYGVLLSTKLVH
jgi:hypothetical protein